MSEFVTLRVRGELLSSGEAREHMARTRGWTRGQWNYWVHVVEPKERRLRPDCVAGRSFFFLRESLRAYRVVRRKDGRKHRPLSFEPDMLTLREVAGRLGASLSEVLGMVRRGELPVDGKRSGTRYVLEGTLERLDGGDG